MEGPDSEQEPVPVLEHYERAVGIAAPLEVNSGIQGEG